MIKTHTLAYKDVLSIVTHVDHNSLVKDVTIKHELFETKIDVKLLDVLVKIHEAYTLRDIKLLMLHIIKDCTPFEFEIKDHNVLADENIIKFVK